MPETKKAFNKVVSETSNKVIELEDRIENLESIIEKLIREINRLERAKLNKLSKFNMKESVN